MSLWSGMRDVTPAALCLAVFFGACTQKVLLPAPNEPTIVYIVRHAERDPGEDPPLNAAGHKRAQALAEWMSKYELSAIYATNFQRTQQTAANTATARGLEVAVWGAHDVQAVASHIRKYHTGKRVLLVAHSDTIGKQLQALGIHQAPKVSGYGQLFVLTLSKPPRLELLHFGE